MLNTTKKFFAKDGKTVVVAMDHGMHGIYAEFENPRATLEKIVKGEPDGILCNPNFARYFGDLIAGNGKTKIVVRLDAMCTSTTPGATGGEEIQMLLSDFDEAKSVGGDAVCTLLIYGRENPALLRENIEYIADVSKDAHLVGMPHICEVPLWGKACPTELEKQDLFMRHACRCAFEFGADVIKGPVLHDRKNMKQLTSELPIPFLALGGLKMGTEMDVFKLVKEAMEDGCMGIVIGRNIWQHPSADKMVKALNAIVHEDATVAQAAKILK